MAGLKNSKTSSASSSAKARPKGNAAAAKVSKSTKENATTTASSSTTTKETTELGQKPAANPLKTLTPSSQGLNDAEIAALLAKVNAQKGMSQFFWLALSSGNFV
jgi:hypothetical protein